MRGAVVMFACAVLGCEPARSPSPTPTPQPTPTPTPPAPDAPPPADAKTTDPSAAIEAAEEAMRRKCERLVYKDGCRVTRHGRVELSVTLDATGKQTKIETRSNTVTVDAPMVLECARKALADHVFDPPGITTTLTVVLVLADMC
jgi:hypothetical protein